MSVHERMKHVKVDCHFIKDKIQAGIPQTKHVSTTNQLADVFIKTLGGRSLQTIISKLGIRDLHTLTWEDIRKYKVHWALLYYNWVY